MKLEVLARLCSCGSDSSHIEGSPIERMLKLLLRSQLLLGLCQSLGRRHALLPPELIKRGHQLGGALVRHSPERADGSSKSCSDEGGGKGYRLIRKLGSRALAAGFALLAMDLSFLPPSGGVIWRWWRWRISSSCYQ